MGKGIPIWRIYCHPLAAMNSPQPLKNGRLNYEYVDTFLFSEGLKAHVEIIEDSSIFEAMYYSNRHAFGKLARNK